MHFVNTEISWKIGRSLSCLTCGRTQVLRDHHSNGNKRESSAKISSQLDQLIIIHHPHHQFHFDQHQSTLQEVIFNRYLLFEMISWRHETSCGGPLPGIYHLWMLSSSGSNGSSSSKPKQATVEPTNSPAFWGFYYCNELLRVYGVPY